MSKRRGSILYVNFAPYENTGNILDYLLAQYTYVFLFVFNFHTLGKKQRRSHGEVYINGKHTSTIPLLTLKVPQGFIFVFLPLRSAGIFLQILWHTYRLKRTYGAIDTYFTVNAFTAWVGNVLVWLKLVTRQIFWVWDYYPPLHPDKVVVLMRWVYWQFDKSASTFGRVVYLNRKLEQLRRDIGILPKSLKHDVVGIGTSTHFVTRRSKKHQLTLGFIGVLKNSQGLDMVFDASEELVRRYPNIRLKIIGSGPYEQELRARASSSPLPTSFYGLLSVRNPKAVSLFSDVTIGLALYVPDESNVSYYGDPSKIKDYLSFGIPVITTNVFEFSKEIKKYNAGLIIPYGSKKHFIRALRSISHNYALYTGNAKRLARRYEYNRIYPDIFKDTL